MSLNIYSKLLIIKRLIKGAGLVGFIRTIIFNLRYFPFKIAIKLPVILYNKVYFPGLKRGHIIIENPGFNRLSIGYNGYTYPRPCFFKIDGVMIIRGTGVHYILPGANIKVMKNGIFEIGDNFSVAFDFRLTVTNQVVVGNNNMWSYHIIMLDSDMHQITDTFGNVINHNGRIVIGDNVWIGCRATVLKDVQITDNVIIGSNSLITENLKITNAVYAGIPAKCIKQGVMWKRDYI